MIIKDITSEKQLKELISSYGLDMNTIKEGHIVLVKKETHSEVVDVKETT